MKLMVNPSDRRVAIHTTMDDLRTGLFKVFDGIIDKTISSKEVEDLICTSNAILATIREESDEHTKQLERAVIEKERLADAITVLAETIDGVENIRDVS